MRDCGLWFWCLVIFFDMLVDIVSDFVYLFGMLIIDVDGVVEGMW